VVVAFRSQHQRLVDSWLRWLEEFVVRTPDARFYELPAISSRWNFARGFIDGGMARSIKDPIILQRTLTYYGNLDALTQPLGITTRHDIHVLALRDGEVAPRRRFLSR
jgi:hypothetical protein